MATGLTHLYQDVHGLAREVIKGLPVHPLYSLYQPGLTERKNITADLDEFAPYPSIDHSGIGAAYARFLRQIYPGLSIGHQDLVFTRGSIEALELLVRAFCEPRTDPVMVTPPLFPEYERLALINGNPIIRVPLLGEDFVRLDVEGILAQPAKLLFLCNPNNPVGSVLDDAGVQRVLAAFPGIVVMDEAYAELALPSFQTALRLFKDHPNLVVVRTLSKGCTLAGLRLGALCAERSILNAVRKLVNPFALSSPVQTSLLHKLADTQQPAAAVAEIVRRRDALQARLAALPNVTKIFPSHANFILIRVADLRAAWTRLEANACLASDISMQIPNAIKLTVGTPADNERLIAALAPPAAPAMTGTDNPSAYCFGPSQ